MNAEWSGLWHATPPRPWSARIPTYIVVYLVVPLGLSMVFAGHEHSFFEAIARGYPLTFLVTSSIAICFELQYRLLWPRLVRRRPSWPVRIAGHAVAVASSVYVGGLIVGVVAELLWGMTGSRDIVWRQSIPIAAAVVAIGVLADELSARARAHERVAIEARLAQVRSELSALQARTDPHFLFNSLNTVAALIPDDPQLAETVLERLAVVFRYALDAGRRTTVPLVEELAAVEGYLEVEALRLGDRLVWRVERTGTLAADVPPLILQPLAENAIKHGAGTRLGATELVVRVHGAPERLVLAVEDRPLGDDLAVTNRVTGGAGVALADIEKRLALAYGENARLTSGPYGPGWRAVIEIAR